MISTDYIFGKKKAPTGPIPSDIVVGGVSAILPDSQSFSVKFQIPVANILDYKIIGDTVIATVNAPITPANSYDGFRNVNEIYSITDRGGKMASYGAITWQGSGLWYFFSASDVATYNPTFKYPDNNVLIELPNLTGIPNGYFISQNTAHRLYIPKCRQLGDTVGFDNVFQASGPGTTVWCDPFLETVNNGNPDGDLTALIAQGGEVVYIRDYTPPSTITDLNYTGGTLNFTLPSSINGIKWYMLFVNDAFRANLTTSGTAQTFNPGDKVRIFAADIYLNKSESNTITI